MLVDEVAEKVDCVFCQLIAGAPARWVAQEDLAVAFSPRPQGQLAEGHTLVVPRLHCEGVLDAPAEALQATTALVQRVGRAMQQALGASGVVVLNASGPASGQSVPHLHFHVVPCWPDDGVTHWPNGRSAHRLDGDDEVHARIAAAIGWES
ncbi:HIT family protein [Kineococcus sp. R86509]|uniref:HIT family protein n=1 Tax=Kineococcus sp. R86509 TaxID=3093851 RepID=UPI0036D20FA1